MTQSCDISVRAIRSTLTVFALCSLAACQSSPPPAPPAIPASNNNLTHGAVQLKLQKGVTTQTEVLEAFGAPNISTIDGEGKEVWTYRRHATVTSTSGSNAYFNVLVVGASGGSGTESTTTQSMTLIIKFDENKRVSDFRSMASSF
jgi:outer membrane protein assembly factor BamE (lipoprotein component of BamABCDE complex)